MVQLYDEIEVTIKPDGKIYLRQPTTAEWNHFTGARFTVRRGKKTPDDNSGAARVELFDVLFLRLENITVGDGSAATCETLPPWLKTDTIGDAFENRDDVEVKN